MKQVVILVILLLSTLFNNSSVFSQTNSEIDRLKQEFEELKRNQTAIRRDLSEIQNLLLLQAKQGATALRQPGPTPENPTIVNLEGGGARGNNLAKVTLVEFTDYQCPFCGRHFHETMPQIVSEYVNTGKLRYVIRDFPLESIHPRAFRAAEAANCSAEQGKYWEMHDRLFGNQNALSADHFVNHALAMGLDTTAFKSCMESARYASKIRRDLTEAQKAGVTGTPTFFLGFTDATGSEIRAVKMIVGAQNYSAFKSAIDSLIKEQ